MNVELLLKVKEAILAHPEHFDMSNFFSRHDDVRELRFDTRGPVIQVSCGTTACIAGWAIALNRGVIDGYPMYGYGEDSESVAAVILGIDWFLARDLFYAGNWDALFFDLYYAAKSKEERAKIAADYIDYFIAKHTKAGDEA